MGPGSKHELKMADPGSTIWFPTSAGKSRGYGKIFYNFQQLWAAFKRTPFQYIFPFPIFSYYPYPQFTGHSQQKAI